MDLKRRRIKIKQLKLQTQYPTKCKMFISVVISIPLKKERTKETEMVACKDSIMYLRKTFKETQYFPPNQIYRNRNDGDRYTAGI